MSMFTDTTALQTLVKAFRRELIPTKTAQQHAERLLGILTQRHSTAVFQGQLARHDLGLRFGANTFLLDKYQLRVYGHHHAKLNKWMPHGGDTDGQDKNDVLATGLRELLEETGTVKDVAETSPLYPHREALVWLPQPIVDVHFMESTIVGKPQPWCFVTLGLVAPPEVVALGLPGTWRPLDDVARDTDAANSRAATVALRYLLNERIKTPA